MERRAAEAHVAYVSRYNIVEAGVDDPARQEERAVEA